MSDKAYCPLCGTKETEEQRAQIAALEAERQSWEDRFNEERKSAQKLFSENAELKRMVEKYEKQSYGDVPRFYRGI